jgi:hypothetical protein
MVEGVNYTIHDNFLAESEFVMLQTQMMAGNFPWYYTDTVNGEEYSNDVVNKKQDFLFSHLFYNNGFVHSPHMSFLSNLITKINPFSLLRIKANMYPRTSEIVQHGWHVDYKNVKFKTAIFYINTSNGKTIFKDGLIVDSVQNRLVEFDTDLLHCSTTCTDQKVRCNINLNYVPSPDGYNINYKSYI